MKAYTITAEEFVKGKKHWKPKLIRYCNECGKRMADGARLCNLRLLCIDCFERLCEANTKGAEGCPCGNKKATSV